MSLYPTGASAGGGGTPTTIPGGPTAGTAVPLDGFVALGNSELILGTGYFSLNLTTVAGSSGGTVSRLKMHGVHSGANATSGTVVTIVQPPVAADTLDFVDCEFWNITWTCADTTLNAGFFVGYGCVRNSVHDCLYIDFAPSIVYRHGLQFRFERNLIRTSGSPPAHVNSNVFDCLSLWAEDNDIDFDTHTMQGAGQNVIFGASGASTAGQSFAEYWVKRNKFFVSNATNFGVGSNLNIVVALDLEAGQATVPPTEVWFEDNDVWNSNVDINSGTDVWVQDNRAHYTSTVLASALITNPFHPFVYVIGTGSARTLDQLHIERNTVYQDNVFNAGAPNTPSAVTWCCIKVDSGVNRLWIRGNTLLGNGSGTAPSNGGGVIQVSIANATSGTLGTVDISENILGMTTDPGANVNGFASAQTASSAISVGDFHSAETFAQVNIKRNVLSPALAATYQVAAFAINGFASLLQVGIATKTTTITDLQVNDNDCSAYTPATGSWTPSATQPFLITTAGTQAITKFQYRGNLPRLKNTAKAQGAQVSPVIQLTIPAGFPDLLLVFKAFVNITTHGTESFVLQDVFTPENTGSAQTQGHTVQTPGATTLVTTITGAAGQWNGLAITVAAKANTSPRIITNAGTYTGGVVFDVGGEIEVLGEV